MKQLEQQNKRQADRQKEIDDAKALKAKLEEIEVEVSAKTGEGGKLFGSVSTKQIVKHLKHNMILKLINVKWIYLKVSMH